MNLKEKIIFELKGISKEKAKVLNSIFGIISYYDLLFHFPYRYENRDVLFTTVTAPIQKNVQIKGKIFNLKEVVCRHGKRRLVGTFCDKFGCIEIVWFKNFSWLIKSIHQNIPVVIYGKLNKFNEKLSISHPEIQLYSVYLSSNIKYLTKYSFVDKTSKIGITNHWYRIIYKNLFNEIYLHINENLTKNIIYKFNLLSRNEALKNIHLPENKVKLKQAYYRFKFEEIFFFSISSNVKKINKKNNFGHPCKIIGFYFNEFYRKYLPFSLTTAQKRVVKEIRCDMKKSKQMNRLLQGDVGSGKTIVELLSILIAIDNKLQTCIMVPTEILANQHYYFISKLTFSLGITIELLSSSTKKTKRDQINFDLQTGNLNILVATHAVLEDKVQFNNLGLVIIDEQHRFGVEQRAKLWGKNLISPHILIMTATPIPRTLAMSYYADLDLSIIDELPKGRKPIKTIHIYDFNRNKIIKFLKDQIDQGFQVYYVYPLIYDNTILKYKNLIDGFKFFSQYFPSPDYNISILHGKMSTKEKNIEINKFIKKKTQLMLTTTVIEVGVNINNVSIIVIENAECFGLAQLHQLRGRVGRGIHQSYCFLITKLNISKNAKIRINTMCNIHDGFKISDIDLKLRGAGNFLGTQQSGGINFKFFNFIKDKKLIITIKEYVDKLLQSDPQLKNHQIIKKFIFHECNSILEWGKIS